MNKNINMNAIFWEWPDIKQRIQYRMFFTNSNRFDCDMFMHSLKADNMCTRLHFGQVLIELSSLTTTNDDRFSFDIDVFFLLASSTRCSSVPNDLDWRNLWIASKLGIVSLPVIVFSKSRSVRESKCETIKNATNFEKISSIFKPTVLKPRTTTPNWSIKLHTLFSLRVGSILINLLKSAFAITFSLSNLSNTKTKLPDLPHPIDQNRKPILWLR